MARLTTALPYALFTVLVLLFLSSIASAEGNVTAITNGTYTKPTISPTSYTNGPTIITDTQPTPTVTGTGKQPTGTQASTAGSPLSFTGTGTAESLFGVLLIGLITGLGLELGL